MTAPLLELFELYIVIPIVNNKVIKYDLLCILFISFTIIIPSFVVIFATFAFGFTWFVKTDIREFIPIDF